MMNGDWKVEDKDDLMVAGDDWKVEDGLMVEVGDDQVDKIAY
jgi:hypothetical protein